MYLQSSLWLKVKGAPVQGWTTGLSRSPALTQQGHTQISESSAFSNKSLGKQCFHTDSHEQGNYSKTAFQSQTSQADHREIPT